MAYEATCCIGYVCVMLMQMCTNICRLKKIVCKNNFYEKVKSLNGCHLDIDWAFVVLLTVSAGSWRSFGDVGFTISLSEQLRLYIDVHWQVTFHHTRCWKLSGGGWKVPLQSLLLRKSMVNEWLLDTDRDCSKKIAHFHKK